MDVGGGEIVLPFQIVILYFYRIDSALGSAFGIRGDAGCPGALLAFAELMGLRVFGGRRLTKSVGRALGLASINEPWGCRRAAYYAE